jgi:SAM-dependent methyltransferase
MNIELTLARMRHLATRAWAAAPVGAGCLCCVCGRAVRRFLPYRGSWSGMPPVLADMGVIGSDIENFECPACTCHDRERHLLLYLQASGMLAAMSGARILHLAPERHLKDFIAQAGPDAYTLGDLYPSRDDIRRIDLLDIDCPDASLDFVIANHVLEHVSDDARALREILRVLRPGGHAILQTPYASRLQSKFEDASITDEHARLHAYGQEDHCRLYGADFPDFVASFGFVSKVATHAALLPAIDARRMGVNALEPFLLFAKPRPL